MGKYYSIRERIGKVKYLLSFHDGLKKEKDGSPFHDIRIFRNKIKLNLFIKELKEKGYKER